MKLLLPLRIGRDEFDLVNLWSIVMGFWSTVFVHFSNALGTKRSDSCCAVIPAVGSQRNGSRAPPPPPPPYLYLNSLAFKGLQSCCREATAGGAALRGIPFWHPFVGQRGWIGWILSITFSQACAGIAAWRSRVDVANSDGGWIIQCTRRNCHA